MGQKKLEDELKSKENCYKNLQVEHKNIIDKNEALTRRILDL